MRRRLARVSWLSLLVVGCSPATNGVADRGESETVANSEGACSPGQIDCACTMDGGCDPGLACVDDLCAPGDGDGDPSGDGDGDPSGDGDGDPSGDGDGDGGCTKIGCDCDGLPDSCDPTLLCIDGTCVPSSCGDATLDPGEVCDDGNSVDGDGCDNDCTATEIQQVAAGGRNTCALIEGGRIRCWGEGGGGVVGLGTTDDVGDDEFVAMSMDIALPLAALAIDIGESHVCATFEDDAIRCWGVGDLGRLGNANVAWLGDDETLGGLPGVQLGGDVEQFSVGGAHTCARLPGDSVRCWGRNNDGQLGIGSTEAIGDDEIPGSIPMLAAPAMLSVAAGGDHTCGITAGFELICWGRSNRGQLGYGNKTSIGNDPGESPNSAGLVDAHPAMVPQNATLADLSLGKEHSCARFSSGQVICWGRNDHGQLGRGDTNDWGDNAQEPPAMLEPISLGGNAIAISAGLQHTCALLEDGSVRCWGLHDKGQLGLGDIGTTEVGDDELPSDVAVVELGGPAVAISAGWDHSCALLATHELLCWGENLDGRLGYGHTDRIGDDETPVSAGSVDMF